MKLLALISAAGVASAVTLSEALASENSTLSSLVSLLQTQPETLDALNNASNITLLAPSNSALDSLMSSTDEAVLAALASTEYVRALLSYHVLSGVFRSADIPETPAYVPTLLTPALMSADGEAYTSVMPAQVVEVIKRSTGDVQVYSGLRQLSTVSKADITFDGGVIHVIDAVLTLPLSVSETAVQANLTALAGALQKVSLVDAVNNLEQASIFAPNNEAFQAISNLTPDLTDEALSDILTYHVVENTVAYSGMLSNTSVTTLNGGQVTITVYPDGSVFVNNARVVMADVFVKNGVVHVIDGVLNPSNSSASPDPSNTTPAVHYSGAAGGSDTPFTSGVPTPTLTSAAGNDATSSVETANNAASLPTGMAHMAALLGGAAVVAVM